jgi:ankyrin repeat protein
VDKANAEGWTPLMRASWGGDCEMVRLLLGLKARARVELPGEKHAFEMAEFEGHVAVLSRLAGWR